MRLFVIPGFAGPQSGIPGMQSTRNPVAAPIWIPAFAGMTEACR
jgi:hypothetical protein